MEEKERYEVISNKKNFIEIQDIESNVDTFITEDTIEDLLNQQSKRIKELEQENRELHTAINLSIPNQIAMKDEYERLHTCVDNRIAELENENQQLKQQLHELPKKIVEEITNELSNNTSLLFT